MSSSSFELLPTELIVKIFSYLDPISLAIISECCKPFKAIIDNNIKPEQWGPVYSRLRQIKDLRKRYPHFVVGDPQYNAKKVMEKEIQSLCEMKSKLESVLSDIQKEIQLSHQDLLKFKKSILKNDYNTLRTLITEIKSNPKTAALIIILLGLGLIYSPVGIIETVYYGNKMDEENNIVTSSPAYIAWEDECQINVDLSQNITQSVIDSCVHHQNLLNYYSDVFIGLLLSSVMTSALTFPTLLIVIPLYFCVRTNAYIQKNINNLTTVHSNEWQKIKEKYQIDESVFDKIKDIVTFIDTYVAIPIEQNPTIKECLDLLNILKKELSQLERDFKASKFNSSPFFKDGMPKTKLYQNVNDFFNKNKKVNSSVDINEQTPLLNAVGQ